ncbi:MAG: cytidyltransferase, partial [Rhizobacter sp.]|nr:cytidyltransferase [Rhizobacter sp.]
MMDGRSVLARPGTSTDALMTLSHDVAVYIGRFQPFHVGHLALLRKALDVAPLCVVVLGSSFQARTPKNPFTWQERAEMVRLALTEAERGRVLFLPLRDYYNEPRWVAGVQRGVARLMAREHLRVVLVGHFKDATSEYLRQFPGWTVISVERQAPVDGTHLRDALFGAQVHDLDGAMALIGTLVPQGVASFLRAWTALPFFVPLTVEWQMLAKSKREWASAPYPPVFVTVDAVVQCAGQVLLIERGRA